MEMTTTSSSIYGRADRLIGELSRKIESQKEQFPPVLVTQNDSILEELQVIKSLSVFLPIPSRDSLWRQHSIVKLVGESLI